MALYPLSRILYIEKFGFHQLCTQLMQVNSFRMEVMDGLERAVSAFPTKWWEGNVVYLWIAKESMPKEGIQFRVFIRGWVQLSSVAQLCPTPWTQGVATCSTPGFPVHHQLPELTQTHVHWAGDAIQPSHPLSSPSPPDFNVSQLQGLFQWVSSLHQVTKILEFQLQHQSFQWILRTDFLYNGLVGSPCSPRDSQESSPTPQFKSINSSALSFLFSPTLTSIHDHWKYHSFDKMELCWQNNASAF